MSDLAIGTVILVPRECFYGELVEYIRREAGMIRCQVPKVWREIAKPHRVLHFTRLYRSTLLTHNAIRVAISLLRTSHFYCTTGPSVQQTFYDVAARRATESCRKRYKERTSRYVSKPGIRAQSTQLEASWRLCSGIEWVSLVRLRHMRSHL
jgi:hypothetical protein